MDDGKCLLDVISDPQALKEFFRSPSQIGFVDSDISPVKPGEDSTNIDNEKQENDLRSVVRNETSTTYITKRRPTSIHTAQATASGNVALQSPKTKPLAHFSYPTSSGLNLTSAPFASNTASPLKNGQIGGNINSSSVQTHYVTVNDPGASGINRSLPQTNTTQKHVVQTPHNMPLSISISNEQTSNSLVNTPLSFAFGDANKARTILSSGTSVSSLDKPRASTAHLGVGQQFLGHTVQLKQSPQKQAGSVAPTSSSPVRTGNSKGQPLAQLRPKKIVPRPVTQQNVGTVVTNDHSAFLAPGTKGKVVSSGKGQPLIAIQPKLIITSQANIVSPGIASQGTLAGNIPVASKLPLPTQAINSLLIQQPKPGVQNGSQTVQNKVSANNLVQLQPKQIAPKPGQASIGFQAAGKQKVSQEQLQQQLVQNLLAKSQQNQPQQQFVLQPGSGQNLKNNKQDDSIEKQQEQLKELLQRNQLLQQVIQVQRLQQQQNVASVSGSQVGMTAGQRQVEKKPAGQSAPLLPVMNNTVAQQKITLSAGQSVTATANPGINNISGSAISAKQLQQFLEKNPLVAQQLKQINLKQGAAVTRNLNATTATVSVAKNIGQPQKPAAQPLSSASAQVAAPIPKKVVVASPVAQPQTIGANRPAMPEQKVAGAQKVLLVQSNTGTTPVGQPRVLLQTKEGRPILLTQEQFKQIQQQLASKNLTIQAKLVTTTTNAPQVVVKTSDPTTAKPIPKVATTSTSHVKQEIAKGLKRAGKPVETEESKLIKRMKGAIQKDQNDVSFIDIHKPFASREDAVKKLVSYHVFSEPEPNAKMQRKANVLLDKLALQLTKKSDRMINKYRQLLLGDMQRDVPSAELVMVNRIFLADEKAALMNEKKTVLEEARKMSQSLTSSNEARSSSIVVKQEAYTELGSTEDDSCNTKNNERPLDFLLNATTSLPEETSSPMGSSEPHQIDIMDDSPSPMASANSFLTHISTNSTLNLSERTSHYKPEPS